MIDSETGTEKDNLKHLIDIENKNVLENKRMRHGKEHGSPPEPIPTSQSNSSKKTNIIVLDYNQNHKINIPKSILIYLLDH
jgi:hypothetical protein